MSLDILDILRKTRWSNAKTFLQNYKKETVSYKGRDFSILFISEYKCPLEFTFPTTSQSTDVKPGWL